MHDAVQQIFTNVHLYGRGTNWNRKLVLNKVPQTL